jgi:Domain of unknown function (DUF1992)
MLDFLVEQKLEEAVSRGELENLPGEGRPLSEIEAVYYEKALAKRGR